MLWPLARKAPAAGVATDIAPPLGSKVWLLQDQCAGRVVARIAGGLVCRIRLHDWAGTTVERPCCDLVPFKPGEHPAPPAANADEALDAEPALAVCRAG